MEGLEKLQFGADRQRQSAMEEKSFLVQYRENLHSVSHKKYEISMQRKEFQGYRRKALAVLRDLIKLHQGTEMRLKK